MGSLSGMIGGTNAAPGIGGMNPDLMPNVAPPSMPGPGQGPLDLSAMTPGAQQEHGLFGSLHLKPASERKDTFQKMMMMGDPPSPAAGGMDGPSAGNGGMALQQYLQNMLKMRGIGR